MIAHYIFMVLNSSDLKTHMMTLNLIKHHGAKKLNKDAAPPDALEVLLVSSLHATGIM